jgi:hypothetical protein
LLVCNVKLTSETKNVFAMKNYKNCTFILLGDFTQKKNGFADKVALLLKSSLGCEEILFFRINEAISSLINGNSPYASALKNIVDSGKTLPINFISMMVEDFLFLTRFNGTSIFVDFPHTIPYARCLNNSLSIYNREPVVVMSFIDCMTPEIKCVADFLRNNIRYAFFDILDMDDVKQPFAELAESSI